MKNILFRSFMLLAVFATSITAWAEGAGTKEDPCVMEAGKDYEYGKAVWYGKFEIPEDVTTDGQVIEIVCTGTRVDAYTDADYTQKVDMRREGGYSPYKFKLDIPNGTAKGTAYYFFMDSDILQAGTIKITSFGDPTPISLVEVIPTPLDDIDSKPLSAASAYISFTFSKELTITGCTVVSGEQNTNALAYVMGNSVSVDLKATLLGFYEGGMKEGDEVTVTLNGVAAKDGSSSLGDVVAKYKVAAKPTQLVSAENTPGNGLDTFLSWMPETFEHGIVTLTFDGDLSTESTPVAYLSMGNVEAENDYYRENLEVKVEGNKLSVDLRSKLRTIETMNLTTPTWDQMSLVFASVKDANGNYTYSDGTGSLGGYGFIYTYKPVEYTLTTDFTPAEGGSIDGKESVELWMNEVGDGKLSFEAVRFSYVHEAESKYVDVEAKDIKSEVDPLDANATILTIPVPEFSRDADTEVVLTLTGVVTPDGLDHSADLTVKFKTAGYDTAIRGIIADQAGDAKIYNLGGMSVKTPKSAGLYIKNGKTVIVK